MAVKVNHLDRSTNRNSDRTHETGERVEVDGTGHLLVLGPVARQSRPAVAVYAPGEWYKAEVTNNPE